MKLSQEHSTNFAGGEKKKKTHRHVILLSSIYHIWHDIFFSINTIHTNSYNIDNHACEL